MSLDRAQTDDRPITRVEELEPYFTSAERPTPSLVGLEHEKFMFPVRGAAPVPYEGPSGIGAVLVGFRELGWQEFREAPELPVIAMTKGRATLSLEPGGQVELSGTPFGSALEAAKENEQHLAELRAVGAKLGLRAVGLGYTPFAKRSELPWMPKSRYTIMRQTLGARGTLAHHMMQATATVQVSLDWRDEADCARKMNAASRLAPVLLALYANSPLVEGAPSGYLSFRSHVWSDVDPARCGYPPCTLDGGFSYRRYIEWALDAPMLFLRRGGKYLDPKQTFRHFLARGFEGPAMWSDWVDHLSTLFPEVRIKKVLEFRSADSGDAAMAGALAAVLRGLLYDSAALSALETALPKLSVAEHLALHQRAQRQGLKAEVGRTTLAPIAAEVITIAERGLKALGAPHDAALLAPLAAIAASGVTRAEQSLKLWEAKADPLAVLERAQV